MSETYRVVKEFEFPAHKGFSGSSGKTVVKGHMRGPATKATPASTTSLEGVVRGKNPFHNEARQRALDGYAKGGSVCGGAKKAVTKHESKLHPGAPKTFAKGGMVKDTPSRAMRAARGVPVAPKGPMIPNKQSNSEVARRAITDPDGGLTMASIRRNDARGPKY